MGFSLKDMPYKKFQYRRKWFAQVMEKKAEAMV
jgi:hypothetical protein